MTILIPEKLTFYLLLYIHVNIPLKILQTYEKRPGVFSTSHIINNVVDHFGAKILK